jgi:hypothetical protein
MKNSILMIALLMGSSSLAVAAPVVQQINAKTGAVYVAFASLENPKCSLDSDLKLNDMSTGTGRELTFELHIGEKVETLVLNTNDPMTLVTDSATGEISLKGAGLEMDAVNFTKISKLKINNTECVP